jgi:hypothetical protein
MKNKVEDLSKKVNHFFTFDISTDALSYDKKTIPASLKVQTIESWRGSVTLFLGQFGTTPTLEIIGSSWLALIESLAPESGPRIVYLKTHVPYFLPCQLRTAPLIGKTLISAKAQGLLLVGKQRSGAHITSSSLIVYDLDSITQNQLDDIRAGLEQAGIAAACWSSHSIGVKPGVRCRLIIPVDYSLDAPLYSSAHQWVNEHIMFGLADQTGSNLSQCQGVWAAPKDRLEHSFRWVLEGGVLVLPNEALRQPAKPRPIATTELVVKDQPKFDAGQQVLAIATNIEILNAFKFTKTVVDGAGRENAVLRLAGLLRSACLAESLIGAVCTVFGNEYCQPALDDCVIQSRAERYAGQSGSEATLSMIARDLATMIVEHAVATGDWQRVDDAGNVPFQYLATYHGWVLGQLGFVGGAA